MSKALFVGRNMYTAHPAVYRKQLVIDACNLHVNILRIKLSNCVYSMYSDF